MAQLLLTCAAGRGRLLDIGDLAGAQTLVLRDQLVRPATPVIFARRDRRPPDRVEELDFRQVDIDGDRFPAEDESFDIAVWNRDLVTVRDVVRSLREVQRVLTADGLLILSVPNVAALHNRLLLLAGRTPTTLELQGDHLHGFAPASTSRFLRRRMRFKELAVRSVGLHPLTSAALPSPLRGLGHTIVWLLAKHG